MKTNHALIAAAAGALLLLAAPGCSDDSPGSADAARDSIQGGDSNGSEAGRSDGPAGDGPRTDARGVDGRPADGRPTDGRNTDGRAADGPSTDARPTDARATDTNGRDAARADANASSQLKGRIDSTYVWANLQPIVAPDPTHATVTLELKNGGNSAISNIKIANAELSSTKAPPKTHPLSGIKPVGTFSGTLAAGATVTVQYTNTPSTQQTPVAFGCNDKVELSLVISSSASTVSLSTTTKFNCVY